MEDLLRTSSVDVDVESSPKSDVKATSIDDVPEVSPIGLKRGVSSTTPGWLEQAFASSDATTNVKGRSAIVAPSRELQTKLQKGTNSVQCPMEHEQASSSSCKQSNIEHQEFSTCDILDDTDGISLPKLMISRLNGRRGKAVKALSAKGSSGGDPRVIQILPGHGPMYLAEGCGLQMKVIGNVGEKGILTECPKNNEGESAREKDNFIGSDWLTVTGVKLEIGLFWKNGALTELKSPTEVKSRFQVIRDFGQPIVDGLSPHFTDGKWQNLNPRPTSGGDNLKFLQGHEGSNYFFYSMKCAGAKTTGVPFTMIQWHFT